MNTLSALLDFLSKLSQAKVHYTLERNRDEAIMVLIAVPGERWEVELVADGSVEVEVFCSAGEIDGPEALGRRFREFSD